MVFNSYCELINRKSGREVKINVVWCRKKDDCDKLERDIKSLMNLLIMNSALMAEDIRQEKGVDAWVKIFNTAKEIFDDYKKTGKLAI